jgi:heme oxygenase
LRVGTIFEKFGIHLRTQQYLMLSEKLKEETKQNHQQLEKALIGQLKAIRKPEEYAALLKLFYGYFGGLEEKINEAIDEAQLPDKDGRRKTQSLANDLEYLKSNVPLKATDDDLPQITDHLQALGALYVIEGSTLGGKIISKMMQQLGFDDTALSFFNGYGDDTEQMWDTFKQMLNNQAKTSADEQRVVNAANETFRKFGHWFSKN